MQTGLVSVGPVELQYFEDGSGPETVVLVHGYASSAALWRLTQERLAGLGGFRVIALNNRGAGGSGRTAAADDYTVPAFAADLYAAVSALGLSGFTLVGHSMGGATVAQFALEHPGLLKGLVLLNSTPLHGRALADNWEAELRQSFAAGGLLRGDMGLQAAHITAEFTEAVYADIRNNPIERALGGRRSMSGLRLRERLAELTIPTLVIGGDRDDTVGVDNILADYLALPEPLRHLHLFHGLGHSPNVEKPGRLAALLSRFIAEVNAAPTQQP